MHAEGVKEAQPPKKKTDLSRSRLSIRSNTLSWSRHTHKQSVAMFIHRERQSERRHHISAALRCSSPDDEKARRGPPRRMIHRLRAAPSDNLDVRGNMVDPTGRYTKAFTQQERYFYLWSITPADPPRRTFIISKNDKLGLNRLDKKKFSLK